MRGLKHSKQWRRAGARAALSLVAVLLHAPIVQANDQWGGSIAAVSDYVSRGLTQTRGDPAVQLGSYRAIGSAWSIGGAISSVDLGDWIDASYEVSATLKRHWRLGEQWTAQAGYTRYLYPGEHGDYDYGEWTAALSFRNWITATAAFFPDASIYSRSMTAWREDAWSIDLAMLQPLTERWSLLGGVGYYELPDAFRAGYWFWSTGLAFSWNALQIDLVHIDTDATALSLFGHDRAGSRWSAALMWKF